MFEMENDTVAEGDKPQEGVDRTHPHANDDLIGIEERNELGARNDDVDRADGANRADMRPEVRPDGQLEIGPRDGPGRDWQGHGWGPGWAPGWGPGWGAPAPWAPQGPAVMLPQGPPPPFPPPRVLTEDDLEMIVARITQGVMNLLQP